MNTTDPQKPFRELIAAAKRMLVAEHVSSVPGSYPDGIYGEAQPPEPVSPSAANEAEELRCALYELAEFCPSMDHVSIVRVRKTISHLQAENARLSAALAEKEQSFLLQRDNYIKLADAIIGEGTFVCEIDPLEAVSQLKAALAEAESWKSQQLAVESDWDAQVVGRTLGMKLGDNIRRNLLPKIQQLQAQLASQQEALVAARDALERHAIITTEAHWRLQTAGQFACADQLHAANSHSLAALARVNACLPEENT